MGVSDPTQGGVPKAVEIVVAFGWVGPDSSLFFSPVSSHATAKALDSPTKRRIPNNGTPVRPGPAATGPRDRAGTVAPG